MTLGASRIMAWHGKRYGGLPLEKVSKVRGSPSSGNKPGFGIRRVVRSDMLGEVGQEGKRKQTE